MLLLISLLFSSLLSFASDSAETLVLDMSPNGLGGITRPFPQCQWAERDLTHSMALDFITAGTGAVIRVNQELQIKMWGPKDKPVWQKVDFLTAYDHSNSIYAWSQELFSRHKKKGIFYETPEHLDKVLNQENGFKLEPGTLIAASIVDPAMSRRLFWLAVLEFVVLQPFEVNGTVVYKPTGRSGRVPMETAMKSMTIVFPSNSITLTGRLQAEKAAREKLAQESSCESQVVPKKKK